MTEPMNDTRDPLEVELSVLPLQPISAGLRQRIAEGLEEPVPARSRSLWSLAFAGSMAAACLAAVVWHWIDSQAIEARKRFVGYGGNAASVTAISAAVVPQPTLLAYQRALARSPEELDVLLNQHALATPLRDPQPVQVGAFTRSDAALHALLGDD